MKKLEGIIAPMATPLTRDEKIDDKTTRTLVDFLIDGGIDGLFPLGTSGEFALFDREERKTVIETVVDHTNGRVPVLAGVSDPGLENVLAFAKDAKDAGADAIVATPRTITRLARTGSSTISRQLPGNVNCLLSCITFQNGLISSFLQVSFSDWPRRS